MKKLTKREQRIKEQGFQEGVRLCLEDNQDALIIGKSILEVVERRISKMQMF